MTEMNEEKAAEVLLEAQRKKQEAFARDYEKLVEKHGCMLVGTARIEDGRIVVDLQVRQR